MMKISPIKFNQTNRISFKADENKEVTGTETSVEESKMSTNTKIGIGVSAAVALAALGYAGYKGHLGAGIQKMLGGATEAVENATSRNSDEIPPLGKPHEGGSTKPDGEALNADQIKKAPESEVTGEQTVEQVKKSSSVQTEEVDESAQELFKKIEKFQKDNGGLATIIQEAEKRSGLSLSGKIANFSKKDINKLVTSFINEDEPVLQSLAKNFDVGEMFLKKVDTNNSIEKVCTVLSYMRKTLDENSTYQTLIKPYMGTDSFLLKKFSELTAEDVKPFLEDIPALTKAWNASTESFSSFNLKDKGIKTQIEFDKEDMELIEYIKNLDSDTKLTTLLDVGEEEGPKFKVDPDKSTIEIIKLLFW